MSNMVTIDSWAGVSLIVGGDMSKALMVLKDSDIYGEDESLALDCPENHACKCMSK